jgi:hypothetical protein
MSTISCTHELCAADHHHDATPETARHHRVITHEDDAHRVTACWTGDDPTTARVEMTYGGTTVTLTPRDAAFWARALTAGGVWSPAEGGGAAAMAIDLGAAAEVLLYVDPDGEPPEFGSGHLDRSIRRIVAQFFEDDEERAHAGDRS